MKKINKNNWIFFATVFTVLSLSGCASTGSSTNGGSDSTSEINVADSNLTLAAYLRRVPGITVQGTGDNTRVLVRGVSTASGTNSALFVVDGNRVGRSYQRVASLVDINDIDNIQVVKGSQAGSRYGLAGSAGVIEIRTKRD